MKKEIINNFLKEHEKRVVGLDILRSLAILSVLYAHGGILFSGDFKELYYNWNLIKIDGVLIFFVLSGFLIGRILIRTITNTDYKLKDIKNFWIRRWFRTLPNYLFVLTIVILYYIIFDFKEITKVNYQLIYFYTFIQNFFYPHPIFYQEAWSLSIEEWFYLLFPVLMFILIKFIKNKDKTILISILIFLVLPLILRTIKYQLGIGLIDLDEEFRKIIVLRLDSIGYGVLGAFISYKFPEFWRKSGVYFLILGMLSYIIFYFGYLNLLLPYVPVQFSLQSIIVLFFIPYMSRLKKTRFKTINIISIFISLISYSIYLLNLTPVMFMIIPKINNLLKYCGIAGFSLSITDYFLYWILSIFLSYLLYTFYEHPMTKLRDKFSKNDH